MGMEIMTSINTVYTHPVAKVMISMPDDLLERLDAQVRANRETRSGFLRRLAERELAGDEDRRRAEIERLLDLSTAPMGGEAAKLIREDRESH
jgi:metal-responsive CopG/Arc/MetJ family transcriptional regulator